MRGRHGGRGRGGGGQGGAHRCVKQALQRRAVRRGQRPPERVPHGRGVRAAFGRSPSRGSFVRNSPPSGHNHIPPIAQVRRGPREVPLGALLERLQRTRGLSAVNGSDGTRGRQLGMAPKVRAAPIAAGEARGSGGRRGASSGGGSRAYKSPPGSRAAPPPASTSPPASRAAPPPRATKSVCTPHATVRSSISPDTPPPSRRACTRARASRRAGPRGLASAGLFRS